MLVGVRLQGALLDGANLEGAWLEDANLNQMVLKDTNLRLAMFGRVWLGGANLFGTTGLTPEQLSRAYWDENTTFPEGFEPPPMRQD